MRPYDDFGNSSHFHQKGEENLAKRVIPFERKEKKASPSKPNQALEAKIIAFPIRSAKNNQNRLSPLFRLRTLRSSKLIGLIILILILALLTMVW
ncbi:MAG: hypothetical protein K6U11_08725 [bacterium]|nr:hypothetical protein [bacterium]